MFFSSISNPKSFLPPITVPYVVVVFGTGLAVYYALSFEPNIIVACAALLLLTSISLGLKFLDVAADARKLAWTAGIFNLGIVVGVLHTQSIEGELLRFDPPVLMIKGDVESHESREDGSSRLVIRNFYFDRNIGWNATKRVRIYVRAKLDNSLVGESISMRVKLTQIPRPVYPGGFNYARSLYFDGVGAMGFALSPPQVVGRSHANSSWPEEYFDKNRRRIISKAKELLKPEIAGIAIALLTGEKSEIPDAASEAMRDAGLAHLLAISGLHMALVTGILFTMARLSLAAIPFISLRYDVKKIAAVAAWFGALWYLILSGAAVSTQRAFIMTSVVFLAILTDRQPFTMRVVAIAALIVLFLKPHAIFGVGFQMSFAAVVGLVHGYQSFRPYFQVMQRNVTGAPSRIMVYVIGVICSTVIAEIWIAPFAIYHFHQVPLFGLVSNILAVPLTGLVIMPLGLASLVLLPFDGADYTVILMGWGIEMLLNIATQISSIDGSVLQIPNMSDLQFYTIIGAMCLVTAIKSWKVNIGILFVMMLFFANSNTLNPNVLIDETGVLVAVQQPNSESFSMSATRRETYTRQQWEQRFARNFRTNEGEENGHNVLCDNDACAFYTDDPIFSKIVLVKSALGQAEECASADLLIVAPLTDAACAARIIITADNLRKGGAHALWFQGERVFVKTVNGEIGLRPWSLIPR